MIDQVSTLSMWKSRGPDLVAMSPSQIGQAATAADASQGADFSAVLSQLANSTVDAVKAGEATAISGMQGKATIQEVVRSVMSAEQTLQGAIAIRDKAVSAYMELSRMSI